MARKKQSLTGAPGDHPGRVQTFTIFVQKLIRRSKRGSYGDEAVEKVQLLCVNRKRVIKRFST